MPFLSLPPRQLEFIAAALGLLSGAAQALIQRDLGFPDGHLTALDRAMRTPHLALAAGSIGLALALAWPGKRGRWALLAILAAVVVADWVGLSLVGGWMGFEDGWGG